MSVNHYYIAVDGNNANNGTSASTPWQTFAHANSSLALGSTGTVVHVASGTYTEAVSTTKSGTPSARIIWISDTKWGAKIVNQNWQITGSYTDVNGFDITNPSGGGYAFNIGSLSIQSVHLLYNNLHDFTTGGCGSYGVINPNGTDTWVIGNVIRNAGNYGFGANFCVTLHGIYDGGQRTLIQNNVISNITGWGIKSNCEPGACGARIISNNTVFHCGGGIDLTEYNDSGFVCVWDNGIITNNIIVDNGLAAPNGGRFGINYFHVTGTHNTVSNNLIYGNVPSNYAHHDVTCSISPISGTDADGTAGGCPSNAPISGTDGSVFVHYAADGSGDYHLVAGSTAIGAGTPLGAPAQDADGVWRSTTSVDIGAYAFTGGEAPPPLTGLVARVSQVVLEVVGIGLGTPIGGTGDVGGVGGTGSEGTSPARVSQVLVEVVISSNAIGVPTLPCIAPTSLLSCNEGNFIVTAKGSIPCPQIAAADIPAVNIINGQPYNPTIAIGGGVAPAFWNWFEYSPIDDGIYTTTAYIDPTLIEQQRISKINRKTNSIEWSTPYRMFTFKTNALTDSVTNNCSVPSDSSSGIVMDRTILLHDMCISPDGKYLVTALSGSYILSGLNHVISDPGGSFILAYLEKRSVVDGTVLHTSVINDTEVGFGADAQIFQGENTSLTGCVNEDNGRVYFGFITESRNDGQTPTVHIVDDNLDTVVRIEYPPSWPTLGISPGNYYAAMDNHGRCWFSFGSNQLGMVDLNSDVTYYTLTEMSGYIGNIGFVSPYIFGIIFDPIDNTLLIFDHQSYDSGTVYDTVSPLTNPHTSAIIYKYSISKTIAGDPTRLVKTVDWGTCSGSGFYLRPGNRLTVGANKLCTATSTVVLHDLSDVIRLDRAIDNAPGGLFINESHTLTSSFDNTTTNPHTIDDPTKSLWGTYWMASVDSIDSSPDLFTPFTWNWFDLVRVSCPTITPCDGIQLPNCGCGGGPPGTTGQLGDCYGRTPSSVWEAVVVGGGSIGA